MPRRISEPPALVLVSNALIWAVIITVLFFFIFVYLFSCGTEEDLGVRISSATMRNDGLLEFRWVGAVNGSSSALRVAEPR